MRRLVVLIVALCAWPALALAQPPTGVSLLSPLASAVNVPVTVTFTWTGGDRATSYEVKLGQSNYPETIVAICPSNSGCSGKSYTATLSPVTKYYWRITARNARGTKTSSTRTFTTAVASPPPPPPPPPPSGESTEGTKVPPAASITRADGLVFTLGGEHVGDPGTYDILINGQPTGGWGKYLVYLTAPGSPTRTVYTFNVTCYAYLGGLPPSGGWATTGSTLPCQAPPVPTAVEFNPSPEHATIGHYQLEVKNAAGVVALLKDIGKPTPDANNLIRVAVPELQTLPDGAYSGGVRSFGPCGALSDCYGPPSSPVAPFTVAH